MVNHFNELAADPKYKPDEIISALDLQPGEKIADLGAGGGDYTFRFASLVGSEGKVYAVDVNEKYLKYIEEQAAKKG